MEQFEHQVNAPTEPVNETDTLIASLDLNEVSLPENVKPLGKRAARLRRVDVGPKGKVPIHGHFNRPAILLVVEGEYIEYNSKFEQPRRFKKGDFLVEHGDITHWGENPSETEPVVIYAFDLYDDGEECPNGAC